MNEFQIKAQFSDFVSSVFNFADGQKSYKLDSLVVRVENVTFIIILMPCPVSVPRL